MSWSIDEVRAQFPVFAARPEVVYLDSAASAQKPAAVLDAMRAHDEAHHANVHRGVHRLSQEATHAFEEARRRVRGFLNASSDREIVFTRGTTEAINLVASSWGGANLRPGDRILLTELEHHSNIVPWQLVAQRTGAEVVAAGVRDDGSLDVDDWKRKLTDRTRLVAFGHISNALGVIHPVQQLCALARDAGAISVVDGAQGAVHAPVDVAELGCDFYAFSGHKVYGPTGIGALYGREALLEAMPPFQGGGEMIHEVRFEASTWAELPAKFEAGTPAITQAVGLGAAVSWLDELGRDQVASWEAEVLAAGAEALADVPGLTVLGTAEPKAGVLSFVMAGLHPQDIGTLLDEQGIAVRTGHHCCQPLMRRFGVTATTRASLGVYNTPDELRRLGKALHTVRRILG